MPESSEICRIDAVDYGTRGIENETGPLRSPEGREEKTMTEDERTQAQKRLERRLQELDSQRLSRGSTGSRIEKNLCWTLMFFVLCALVTAVVLFVNI